MFFSSHTLKFRNQFNKHKFLITEIICHIIQSKSSWFEKKGKETKLRHLQQWVEDILAGKVDLKEPENTADTAQQGNNKGTNKKEEL